MSRDFEFKQLLRAYRLGVISEAVFEQEMGNLEKASSSNGAATAEFRAFNRSYRSEREAILDFLDRARVGEGTAAVALPKWIAVSKTDCLIGGLRMVCEREGYHARQFEQRLLELGGEKKEAMTDEARKYIDFVADPNISDAEKLLRVTSIVPDVKAAIQPIIDFAESIKEDQHTKEMVALFAQDEMSSATWLVAACKMLNPQLKSAPAEARASMQ